MIKINADFFIDTYEYLYYEPNSIPEGDRWRYYGAKNSNEVQAEHKSKLKKILNISSLNGTDYNAEKENEKLLCQGTFDKYCLEVDKNQIKEHIENNEWEEAYRIVMEVSPENIGPVYNINTLFFLTGGKAPIYD